MKRYKLIKNQDIYCSYCGKKTSISLIRQFDSKTGIQLAKLICRNVNCWMGEIQRNWEKWDSCKHEYSWFRGVCKKCGYKNNSTFI